MPPEILSPEPSCETRGQDVADEVERGAEAVRTEALVLIAELAIETPEEPAPPPEDKIESAIIRASALLETETADARNRALEILAGAYGIGQPTADQASRISALWEQHYPVSAAANTQPVTTPAPSEANGVAEPPAPARRVRKPKQRAAATDRKVNHHALTLMIEAATKHRIHLFNTFRMSKLQVPSVCREEIAARWEHERSLEPRTLDAIESALLRAFSPLFMAVRNKQAYGPEAAEVFRNMFYEGLIGMSAAARCVLELGNGPND